MANAATKSMEQMENLKQILIELNQSTGVQVINMVQENFKTMDAQHKVLYQELQDVKNQLNAMQKGLDNLSLKQPPREQETIKVNKADTKKLLNNLENKVSGLGTHILKLKKDMGEKAAEVVKDFKARGIIAVDNIVGKLGVKEAFKSAEKYFNQQAGEIQKSINTIDIISHEVNEVRTHKDNIGRALKGKDLKEVPAEQGKIFKLLKRPFMKSLEFCMNAGSMLHEEVTNLEKLELKALDAETRLNKNSVLDKLDNNIKEGGQQLKSQREQSKILSIEDKKHEARAER